MAQTPANDPLADLVIRSYRDSDQSAVARLYTHGLLAGHIAPNDTGADIENMQAAYFDDPRHHFWVAESQNRIVGMIGVVTDLEHTAEIRRLRVEKALQDTPIAGRLVEMALAHCKQHAYVKVVFDTRFEHEEALDLFDRFGFQHTGTKPVQGKQLLEFYLDLYRQSKLSDEEG